MLTDQKYHVFIAYASSDRAHAKSLYEILRDKYEVFVDWECLLPGDAWDITLPNAQKNSLITIVLISSNVDEAYYQKEEIASAISLSRTPSNNHRVIPIYLGKNVFEENIPYGLRRLHSIKIDNDTSILDASKKVSKVLDKMPHESIIRRSAISMYEERVKTINEVENLRNTFAKKIDEKAKTSFSKPNTVSLLYLDIDSFTSLNRRYGISVGNEVVKTVKNILEKYCDDNLLTRWGGDSFLACFGDSANNVLRVAESIRLEIYSFEWETIVPRLYATASLGVVEMDDFDNSRSLIERAKEGARLAKKQGGNKVMKGPLSIGPIMQKRDYELWDDMDS